MNVAGQFTQYRPVIEGDSGSPTLPLLLVRDFVSRQWRLIGLVTCLAAMLGVAYLVATPSRYTAQADMIIDTKRVTWTQSELATENRTVEDASVESEIETTKSEKVALIGDTPAASGRRSGVRRRRPRPEAPLPVVAQSCSGRWTPNRRTS